MLAYHEVFSQCCRSICLQPTCIIKMIDILDEQILEHFKESFPPKIESQLLKIDIVFVIE